MKSSDLLNVHKVRGDARGQLVAIEASLDIPFDIKRVFYIYGTSVGIPRGNHAHHKTIQYLISIAGSCKVTLDTGSAKETFTLDKQNVGLLQKQLVWGVMHDFSDDCVLLVLASEHYDELDYITSYAEFLRCIKC